MKTLQECKDEIARRHGFKSWEDARETWIKRTGVARVTHESYIEEVATLYAQSLCKEQREICYTEARIDRDLGGDIYIIEDSIKNAPEPKMI